MTPARTLTEKLALMILAREGISAIWQLHLSAAAAYRDGRKAVAALIIEIAEAAERERLRRGDTRVLNGWPNWRA